MWYIRLPNKHLKPKEVYDGSPTLFTIKLYHGGEFTKFPERRYEGGKVNYVDMVDIDEFSIHDLDTIMKGMRCTGNPLIIYYHFLVPNGDFYFGLRPLGNDQDVVNLGQYVAEHKLIRVFTEHCKTTLLTYFLDPRPVRKVIIQELEEIEGQEEVEVEANADFMATPKNQDVETVNPRSAIVTISPEYNRIRGWTKDKSMSSCSKRLNMDFEEEVLQDRDHGSGGVGSVQPQPQADFDIGLYQQILQADSVNDVNLEYEREAAANKPAYPDYTDMDFEFDQDIEDFFSGVGVNGGGANDGGHGGANEGGVNEGGANDEYTTDLDDVEDEYTADLDDVEDAEREGDSEDSAGGDYSDDSDFWVESDNEVVDVEVDMRDFHLNVDPEVEFMEKPPRKRSEREDDNEEVVEEVEVIDNDAWESLGEDSDMERKRRALLKEYGVPIKSLQQQLEHKYNVCFSKHKVFRAKAQAKKLVVGDETKQYELLRDYCMELQATNADTTVKLETVSEPNLSNITSRVFKRMYVCLGGMKKGFKEGMRDFLGLDGTFMKGTYEGVILTAVGVDSNNGIYPLAYAIVDKENQENWAWFLECLGDDLELYANSNFTFISDRQKGLLNAVTQVFPAAEHRFCIRHVYENMRKTFSAREYKVHLWRCATATTIPDFNFYMQELYTFYCKAYAWLKKIQPQHWARSHFTGRPVSDMLLNNLCEVFNGQLVDGRDKPIISCLEYIREYMMKRICNVLKVQRKCKGPLTPNATKILDKNAEVAKDFEAKWNGADKYQVKGAWGDQHVVNMVERECSCRKWELSGIPCKHVIAVLYDKADHSEEVGELYTYVHKVHWLETWKAAYAFKVDPIKGRNMWPKSNCPLKITPPPHTTQPGRPKKKRRLTMEERLEKKKAQSQGASQGPSQPIVAGASISQKERGRGKLPRKYIWVTCGTCKGKGHNARGCKNKGGMGAGGASGAGASGAGGN